MLAGYSSAVRPFFNPFNPPIPKSPRVHETAYHGNTENNGNNHGMTSAQFPSSPKIWFSKLFITEVTEMTRRLSVFPPWFSVFPW